jgi:hypothetical protein
MIDFKEYTTYLINNRINERQFSLLYFLYITKEDRANFALMKQFIEVHGITIGDKKSLTTEVDKVMLIEHGWLRLGGQLGYEVTDKFTSSFITTYIAGQEFIAAYPGFTIINGGNAPLKNSDREVVRNLYAQRINYSKAEHDRILLDLDFGKRHDLIKVNIENFVRSEGWWDIRQRRLENNQTGTYIVHDQDF